MRRLLERSSLVLVLFYCTGGLFPILFASAGSKTLESADSDPGAFALQTAFYVLILVFIALRWRRFICGIQQSKPLIILVVLAVLSTAWSQDPGLTLRRSMVLVATTALGIYFGSCHDIREQLSLLRWVFSITAALSLLFVVFLPDYGIGQGLHPGDWQGIFAQKNGLGCAMMLGFLVFASSSDLRPWRRWTACGIFLCLLYLSGSRTALSVVVAMVFIRAAAHIMRLRMTLAVPVAVAALVIISAAALVVVDNLGIILALFGRDQTLTGRTDIWQSVFLAISRRPFLGYGFSAFWRGLSGESATVVLSLRFFVQHAHNGFLDLWLELGLAGLSLFLLSLLGAFGRSIYRFRTGSLRDDAWPLTYLILLVLYNFGESAILKQNNVFWVLYVAVAVSLATASQPAQDEPTPQLTWSHEPSPQFSYLPG
jgi:exopolysaccharide production protein ExoQ